MDLSQYFKDFNSLIGAIVVGFSFIRVYHFTCYVENVENIEHELLESTAVGFVLHMALSNFITGSLQFFVELIIAILLGFALGKFRTGETFSKILDTFQIRSTGMKYYWDDLMDSVYSMRAIIEVDEYKYYGAIHLIEGDTNSPHILLAAYVKYDAKGDIIEDSRVNNKVLILDPSKIKSIEVIYDPRSNKCNELGKLVKYVKKYNTTESKPSGHTD